MQLTHYLDIRPIIITDNLPTLVRLRDGKVKVSALFFNQNFNKGEYNSPLLVPITDYQSPVLTQPFLPKYLPLPWQFFARHHRHRQSA